MAHKVKISVTVSADVLASVDRAAREGGTNRSETIESWLRASASRAAERSIAEATAAYYAALRGEAHREDEAIARASSRAAARVTYDEWRGNPGAPRRGRRR